MPTFESANTILQDVAADLGLAVLPDGMGSAEDKAIQLRTILKRVGRGLVKKQDFLRLRLDHEFNTTSASVYPYPSGYLAMVDGTAWNHSQTRPLHVVSPEQWALVKAQEVGHAYVAVIRPRSAGLELWPQPPASGERITYEYRSKFWVWPVGQDAPMSETPTTGSDVLTIDSHLLVCAMRHAWLTAKGFNSTSAYDELREALMAEIGLDESAAPVLSLNGSPMESDPLLGARNVPTGGYGGGLIESGGLY